MVSGDAAALLVRRESVLVVALDPCWLQFNICRKLINTYTKVILFSITLYFVWTVAVVPFIFLCSLFLTSLWTKAVMLIALNNLVPCSSTNKHCMSRLLPMTPWWVDRKWLWVERSLHFSLRKEEIRSSLKLCVSISINGFNEECKKKCHKYLWDER